MKPAPPPPTPPTATAAASDDERRYVEELGTLMSQRVLTSALREAGLPHSGTRAAQASRIASATSPRGRPSWSQLVYMAAAARRHQIDIGVAVLSSKSAAIDWLARHGDWTGRQ